MPHSVASDLGLHGLPVNLFGVSELKWVNSFDTHPLRTLGGYFTSSLLFEHNKRYLIL